MADEGGVVMDGRDIGSVVLPDAALKIYLDASVDVRAKRRHQELVQKGQSIPLETIRAQVSERDQQDRERAESPLVQVDDAVYLDTSALSPQQAAQIIIDLAWERA
jgi:cytidylate kinase